MYGSVRQTDGMAPGVLGAAKVLRVGIASSIDALDPRAGARGATALVLGQMFEAPAALFESFRAEDDAHVSFSASVLPDVRFSDGTLLTAELAARSLRTTPALAGKAAIDVRGNRIRFRLARPNPRFVLTLTHHACAIVLDKGAQLHGTGPFVFDQRPNLRLLHLQPHIRLVRNPYSRSVAAIQEIHFAVIPPDADGTPRKLLHALRQESIDLTTAVDPAPQLAGLAPVIQPGNSTALLFFNTERLAASIRRGIAAALDRRRLAFACYDRNSEAFAAGSILPPSMGESTGPSSRDLDEAKRLLGNSVHARLTMVVPPAPRPYLPKPAAVAAAIQSQLAEAGVSVAVLEARNEDEYEAALRNHIYDLALGGHIAETPDPDDFLQAVRSRGGDCTPLVYGHTTVVHARHLHGVHVDADGFVALADVRL